MVGSGELGSGNLEHRSAHPALGPASEDDVGMVGLAAGGDELHILDRDPGMLEPNKLIDSTVERPAELGPLYAFLLESAVRNRSGIVR